jgi:hypothetical protein
MWCSLAPESGNDAQVSATWSQVAASVIGVDVTGSGSRGG